MRKVLKGKGVSNGIGFGKVVLLKPEDLKVEKSKIDNVKEETEKLEADYIEKEKQIKKEDGSLFEKIIAECIGGIAETVLDFTTRRKSKCRI